MTLWITDSGLRDAEIRALLAPAYAALGSVSVERANRAALAAADGAIDDPVALAAWRAAERTLPSNLPERALLSAE